MTPNKHTQTEIPELITKSSSLPSDSCYGCDGRELSGTLYTGR